MADPVGIVYDALKKIKNAPEEIKALQEEATVPEGIMPQITDILAKDSDSLSIVMLVSRAEELIVSVDNLANAATKSIKGKWKVKKLRWYFKGKEAKELAEKFRSFYGSLSAVYGVYLTQIPDRIQLLLSHMDANLQTCFSALDEQFKDVRVDVNQIQATLERLVMSPQILHNACVAILKKSVTGLVPCHPPILQYPILSPQPPNPSPRREKEV
ncbi:hypothetical protein PHLCEN_2v11654 [Hermanssonia centrifuga]|uniref:Uncharacterized protein n=1 Tax=Hermanssonia centrifuga TaxID=98765 RepID=A0A2R6NJA8_9APHY|nr:hypothetical protein PHLCEN_2v11654 [Hermanssonia centrifuga]